MNIVVGARETFAIEAEPRQVQGEWIWGGFRLWFNNCQVGDWQDAAALHLCYGWLKKFQREPPDCVEPSLAARPAHEVFSLIVGPVMGPNAVGDPAKQPVPFAYERFHISYLGMSSLDSYVVVLVKDEHGIERCLWRQQGEEAIHQCWLAPGQMERVVGEFCQVFEARLMTE